MNEFKKPQHYIKKLIFSIFKYFIGICLFSSLFLEPVLANVINIKQKSCLRAQMATTTVSGRRRLSSELEKMGRYRLLIESIEKVSSDFPSLPTFEQSSQSAILQQLGFICDYDLSLSSSQVPNVEHYKAAFETVYSADFSGVIKGLSDDELFKLGRIFFYFGPRKEGAEFFIKLLERNPRHNMARLYLALTYWDLPKVENKAYFICLQEAKELLRDVITPQLAGDLDISRLLEEYEDYAAAIDQQFGFNIFNRLYLEIARREQMLSYLSPQKRFQKGFVHYIATPDGTGITNITTLGFPGTWMLSLKTNRYIPNGYILRGIKSISDVLHEKVMTSNFNTLVVDDNISGVQFGQNYMSVSNAYLYQKPLDQRREVRKSLQGSEKQINTTFELSSPSPVALSVSGVVLVDDGKMLLGTEVLSKELDKKGFQTRRVNINSAYTEAIKNSSYVVGLSINDTNIRSMAALAKAIKNGNPDIIIIIGGPSTIAPEQILSYFPQVDCLISGEGVIALPAVLESLRRKDTFTFLRQNKDVRGLYLRLGDKVFIKDLDMPNFVANPSLSVSLDKHAWFTSYGCPNDCSFCTISKGRRYRAASVDDMIEEVSRNIDKTGQTPFVVSIEDDHFIANPARIIAFAHRCKQLGLEGKFKIIGFQTTVEAFFRGEEIREDLIEALKILGVVSITLGVDGITNDILMQNNKFNYTTSHATYLYQHLSGKGFSVTYNNITRTPLTSPIGYIDAMLYGAKTYVTLRSSEQGVVRQITTRFHSQDLILHPWRFTKDGLGDSLYTDGLLEYAYFYFSKEILAHDPFVRWAIKNTNMDSLKEISKVIPHIIAARRGCDTYLVSERFGNVKKAMEMIGKDEIIAKGSIVYENLTLNETVSTISALVLNGIVESIYRGDKKEDRDRGGNVLLTDLESNVPLAYTMAVWSKIFRYSMTGKEYTRFGIEVFPMLHFLKPHFTAFIYPIEKYQEGTLDTVSRSREVQSGL